MNETKTSETSKMPKHPNVEISVKNFGPIAEATIESPSIDSVCRSR